MNNYDLSDVYNLWKERGSKLNTTSLGFWSKNSHLNITLTQSKIKRRSNMNGLPLKMFVYKVKNLNGR